MGKVHHHPKHPAKQVTPPKVPAETDRVCHLFGDDNEIHTAMQYPNAADAKANRHGKPIAWDSTGKSWTPKGALATQIRAEAKSGWHGLSAKVENCRDFGRGQDLLEFCNHVMMRGTARRLEQPPAADAELAGLEHYPVASDTDLESEAYAIKGTVYLKQHTVSTNRDAWFEIGSDPTAQIIPAVKGPPPQ